MATTQQLFDSLVVEIRNAVTRREFYPVCDHATSLGLAGEKLDARFSVRYHFTHTDTSGATLNLRAYSYDPSGPSRARAGITGFMVTLSENGATHPNDTHALQYEDQYEGLVQPRYA